MRTAVAVLLLTLPWLNPFAPGPSAAVGPLLFAWTCTATLALLGGLATSAQPRRSLAVSAAGAASAHRMGRGGLWALVWGVAWVLGALRAVALPGDGLDQPAVSAGFGAAGLDVSPQTLGLIAALLATGLCAVCFAHAGPRARRALAGAWVLAAAVGAVIGWLQYSSHAVALWPWVNSAPPGEAYGNLRQRNLYASGLAIGLAALLWWAQQAAARAGGRELMLRAVGLAALAALLGSALALSASRTGLVALGLLALLATVWRRWRDAGTATVLGLAALAYGATALLLPWLWPQWAAGGIVSRLIEGAPACASRLTLWRNVLHLIAQRPWGGWGWGQLDAAHYLTLYPGLRFCDILDNAHNLPLHWAVELGVPLALLLCAATLWALWHARPWRERDATRQLAWSVLAVIGLHSLLEYPLWYGPFQMAAGASLGLLLRTHPAPAAGASAGGDDGALRAWRLGGALALLVGCAYTAYDYGRVSQIYLEPAARSPLFGADAWQAAEQATVFGDAADFALLTLTPVTEANAAAVWRLGQRLLRYSPEPRVAGALIDSALLLGRDDLAQWHQQRYEAAFGSRETIRRMGAARMGGAGFHP